MKTTIYELLGMIKDGKAPKRIIYKNNCYEWFDDEKDYITETHWLFDEYVITDILNDEVEILETTITMKADQSSTEATNKIKKLEEKTSEIRFAIQHLGIETVLSTYSSKINEIIDKVSKYD